MRPKPPRIVWMTLTTMLAKVTRSKRIINADRKTFDQPVDSCRDQAEQNDAMQKLVSESSARKPVPRTGCAAQAKLNEQKQYRNWRPNRS